MSLEVTKVEFFHLKKGGKVKAFAAVTFNKVLTVKGFKIVEGDDGLFVGKPSTLNTKDDKWYDNIFVKSKDAWQAIQDTIVAEYEDSDGKNAPKKRRDNDEEEAPKKKRRDEDEEERPKKKRPIDEEEEEPKPKKKTRKPTDDEDEDLFE